MAVTAAVLAGCSLPLPTSVQSPGRVDTEQRRPADIQVLPPGPRAGAGPTEVVLGFLGAQSNPDREHAIARGFLVPAERASWKDRGQVLVYDPSTLVVRQAAQVGDQSAVEVTADVTGTLAPDGTYTGRVPTATTDAYALRRDARGTWQLSDVPDGLRLSPADRDRSFRSRRTYFLAPSAAAGAPDHLVPDAVLLPVAEDPAPGLVARLLAGPSRQLEGAVTTAVPPRTRALSVTSSPTGVVTVDLSAQAQVLGGAARQALSAQLVWTLRQLGTGFTGLQLLSEGRPLAVPNTGLVQPSSEWEAYDPEGLPADPPLLYVAEQRLRSIGAALPPGPATSGAATGPSALAVDAAAITPDGTRVALLTGHEPGVVQVRTGPLRTPAYGAPQLRARGLRSPSWGRGDAGLWLVRGGRDVLLLPTVGPARVVPLGRTLPTPLTSLAVSRDGARIALVAGGRLYVGRVEPGGPAGLRVAGLQPAAPLLDGVTTVAWESVTSMVVLAPVRGTVLPVRVPLDGLGTTPFDGPGLPGRPTAVAASPTGVWVAAGAGRGGRLYRVSGRGFDVGPAGGDPAYPG